jgi:hypothetical protein
MNKTCLTLVFFGTFISLAGMIVSSTLVSVFSVMLVAIDRFLYISNGLQYQQYMFPGRVRILVVVAWIVGELNFKMGVFFGIFLPLSFMLN